APWTTAPAAFPALQRRAGGCSGGASPATDARRPYELLRGRFVPAFLFDIYSFSCIPAITKWQMARIESPIAPSQVALLFVTGYNRAMLTMDPHPLLDLRAFVTIFPRPLGEMASPPELQALLVLDAPAPVHSDDAVREIVRQLLRHGGFKPTGRSKPASE